MFARRSFFLPLRKVLMIRRTQFAAVVLAGLAAGPMSASPANAQTTKPSPTTTRSKSSSGTATRSLAAKMPYMASVDSSLFRGMSYRLAGSARGGRVTTVTGVPSEPRTFFMGVASGGLFKTTDGGTTWTPISDGKIPVGSMGSIAVADNDPNIIYVGTGSNGVRSNVSTGRGVYKTTDGGKTFSFAGLYNVGQIGAVRIHPTNPNIVWVAAYGDIFKPNVDRGIFKTTDGGKSWRKTLYVSDSTGGMDLEVNPANPNIVYAWMSRIERKPWTIISGAREGGFFKSVDGGETWKQIKTGLPPDLIGKGNLAVTAANPNRIYALIEALPGGGLYRSDNAGDSWALVNALPALLQRPFYYTTLGADPTNADIVYAGAETFYKSTDGGKTVAPMRTPHGDNHDIWINPNNGQTMIQANDGGANVSFDGGRTWSTQDNQPTAEFYGVWLDNAFPFKMYAAQQDASTLIMSSVGDPFNLANSREGPGCETGPIIPHPTEKNTVYGSCKGQFSVMDLETGQSRNYWIGAQSLYGNDGGDLLYRMQRVSPMALSPHDPNVLYYGSQYLHRTRNKGVTWETISPDLTAFPSCCQGGSGGPITRDVTGEEFYSTLYAITESPFEAGVIWTGANDGPFHITRNDGKTWQDITPKDLKTGGRVAWIEASPHRKGSAYFTVYRYLLGDYAPYVYLTEDYGKTWKNLTDGKNGIPSDWPVRVVREDPDREGLLYAGTEFGMFISFDNGGHWQPFQLNMPNVPINDIKVYRKDLIIATQGRGMYILDNLSDLQQITPQTVASRFTTFKPRAGYRTSTAPALLGPQIDYYLADAARDTVTIEILDAKGEPVNTYKSDAPVARGGRGGRGGAGGDDEAGGDGEFGGRVNADAARMNIVTKHAGVNRFVWGLQYKNGLSAPPGSYQARVTVAGVTQTVPLTVLIDPRIAAEGTTVADLQQQFAHNLKVRALVTDVNTLLSQARNADTRLTKEGGAAADTLAKVKAVESKLLSAPVRYGKPGLQAHITYLASMTQRVDQKVGRDALVRYATLRKALDAVKAELDRALGPIKQ
jgi:photosystem II stability/assembly factor-like uncharacterized protein